MFTNAKDAVEWIHGARYKGQKNGLENTRALLAALNNPERRFRSAHIAGTNGKGSTAAFAERALREAGFRTGMYTSPYLIRYNERVQVMGVPIPDAALTDIVNHLVEKANGLVREGILPTTFELGTALAFEYFARMGVEVAVVEVGLGGRFDSTNVVTPDVSMIAAIGLDHMKTLGDTVEEIAFEKAGIIKTGVPAVVQDQAENILAVFRKAAGERGSKLTLARMPEIMEETAHGARFSLDGVEYQTSMNGRHQLLNASLAIGGLREMGINGEAIRRGIAKAKWPCRLEW
jgi:dihydrofolate synthase/folylpolyglutamate synthase